MIIRFDWDSEKAIANAKKHSVTFNEARTIFFDDNARLINDTDHSDTEERFIMLGMSNALRILTVSHCYRSVARTIRIISARKATRSELNFYP